MTEKEQCQKNFSLRLAMLLENANVSQTELSKVVGVTPQAVSKWLSASTMPDVYNFKVISDFFDVSYEYLLGLTDVKHAKNQTLADALGLSDEAIENLKKLNKQEARVPMHDFKTSEVLSEIIGQENFLELAYIIKRSAMHNSLAISEKEKEMGEYAKEGYLSHANFLRFQALEIMGKLINDMWKVLHYKYFTGDIKENED